MAETSKESLGDPFLNKVEEILLAHYADPDFKVQDLADQLHMDRSQVLKKLKKRTGLAPGDHIKKYRMEQAWRLLQEQAETITEVAYTRHLCPIHPSLFYKFDSKNCNRVFNSKPF